MEQTTRRTAGRAAGQNQSLRSKAPRSVARPASEKAVERSVTRLDDAPINNSLFSETADGSGPAGARPPKKVPLFKRLMGKIRGSGGGGGGGGGGEETETAAEETEASPDWLCPRVQKAEYFHGMIHKDEIGSLLRDEGDVILRLGRSAMAARNVTLSVMGKGQPRHFMIEWEGEGKKRRCWVDPDEKFPDEVALVEAYVARKIPMGAAGYILKRPVTRADWELSSGDVELTKEIGKGAFGKVYLGVLVNPPPSRPGQSLPQPAPRAAVAVKLCDGARESQDIQNKFMKEAEIGRRLCHRNVIRIYGVQCREHPLMIVMEFAGEGSLLGWLRRQAKARTAPAETTLLALCKDAVMGVDYLHQQRVLHRDIAARNFLVGTGRILKIADFGHAKADTIRYALKSKLKMALKWCAPEVMDKGEFGHPSEVWALGVTCWEILSVGEEPFQGIPKKEVKSRVLGADRLHLEPKPSWSPDTAELLRLAFVFSPAARGSTKDLLAVLNRATATPVAKDPNPNPKPNPNRTATLTSHSSTDLKDSNEHNNSH